MAINGLWTAHRMTTTIAQKYNKDFAYYERQLDVLGLLALHREAQATDPRDKIIALIGLTKGNCAYPERGIYTHSASDLYCDTMVRIAQSTDRCPLSFLTYAGYPTSRDDLPSWVPDVCLCIKVKYSHPLRVCSGAIPSLQVLASLVSR